MKKPKPKPKAVPTLVYDKEAVRREMKLARKAHTVQVRSMPP